MPTLKVDKEVELQESSAICNFCGQPKSDCVRGSVSLKVHVPILYHEHIAILSVDKHYIRRFLRGWAYIIPESDEEYRYVEDKNKQTIIREENADICKSCIRQLAKTIK